MTVVRTANGLACDIDDASEALMGLWSRQAGWSLEDGPKFEPPTQRAGELLEQIIKAVAGLKYEIGKAEV